MCLLCFFSRLDYVSIVILLLRLSPILSIIIFLKIDRFWSEGGHQGDGDLAGEAGVDV